MTEQNAQQQIINLVCENITIGISAGDIGKETSLINDLQLDSIQLIELATRLEQEFSMELDEEDLDFQHFSTIGTLASLVESKAN